MGIGRFDRATHKFNLVLSIRYTAPAADLIQLQRAFQRASELLYDATDGRHQFGEIQVCLNSLGGASADAWVIISPNPANPIFDSGGYNPPPFSTPTPGVHMTLDKKVMDWPLVIVHEFAHFVYGLYDEYRFADGTEGAHCIGGTTANACIMEASQVDGDQFVAGTLVSGRISEFCASSNHTVNNRQGSNSCWHTMASRYYDLPDLQTATQAPPTAPAAALANWVVLDSTQRFVLVIDRSGSMTGDKLIEAKFGADWWADAILDNDALGVVSFSDTVSVDFPLHTITGPTDRNNVHAAVGSIAAKGMTSIGGGLRRALQEITNFGPRSVTESIVLLTDGIHNIGESPSQVLPDLIARGVRVFTIGIGPGVDTALLQQIATSTGGTHYVA
jgi:hypothetical protein